MFIEKGDAFKGEGLLLRFNVTGKVKFRLGRGMRRTIGFLVALVGLFAFGLAHADWGPDVRLTYNDSISWLCSNNARCIAIDSLGRVHVVWLDNRSGNYEIYHKRSTDWGNTWGGDTRLTYYQGKSFYPAVAVDGQERVHLVWEKQRGLLRYEVFYKRSTDGGVTWGSDTLLSEVSEYDPFPAIESEGNRVLIAWYQGDTTGGGYRITYRRSLDGGVTWEPVRVLGDTVTGRPSMSLGSLGTIHVATSHGQYVRSTDFGTTWGRDTVLFSGGGGVPHACLGADRLCHVHVVWEYQQPNSFLDVFYKRSSDEGVTWGRDVQMSSTDSLDETYPVIAADDSGYVHFLYGQRGIYYQRSTDRGLTWGAAISLIPSTGRSPHLAVDIRRNVHVVWRDGRDGNGEIYYKRWDAASGIGEAGEVSRSSKLGLWVESPSKGWFHLRYLLPCSGLIDLKVFNLLGQEMVCLEQGVKDQGHYILRRPFRLPAGVYFVCLRMDREAVIRKVVVSK